MIVSSHTFFLMYMFAIVTKHSLQQLFPGEDFVIDN